MTWVSGGRGVACEVVLPQGALSLGPWNYLLGTLGGLVWEQDYPLDVLLRGWENLCCKTRRFSLGYLRHDLAWQLEAGV